MKSIIKKKGKKAQVQSIIIFMASLFVIAITVLLARLIMTNFYSAMDEAQLNTVKMQEAQDSMIAQAKMMDYGTVILCMMFIVGLIFTSFLIPTHPIFIVVNIIGIFILVFVGMLFVNIYGEMVSGAGSELGDTADQYPLINYLMIRLPFIGAIVIMLTSIVMYVRGSV